MAHSSKSGPLTLYEEICNHLREGIEEGVLSPGSRIDSESLLMKRFGVSRVTVRNAISRLVREGLLVRRQGKGTFVVSPHLEYRLGDLQGTPEVLASQGMSPRMKVLSQTIVRPEARVQRALQLGPEDGVLRMERQDLAGNLPVAFAIIHVPEDLGRHLAVDDLEREPLYRLLWSKCGVFVDRAHQTIKAVRAGFHVAALLDVPVGDPLMLAERITHSSDDRPVECATVFYRSEILHFAVELRRSHPTQNLEANLTLDPQLAKDVLVVREPAERRVDQT